MVITVTNADDDGEVTLSSIQPKVGIDFTATLADPDGGVKDVKWQWAATEGPCAALTFVEANDISKAKSDTYTPMAANVDGTADCLRATATYTDNHGSGKTAMAVSDFQVIVDLENRAPVFRDTNDKVISSDTRDILENSVSDADADATPNPGDVGVPVTAQDPNASYDNVGVTTDAEGTLTYTLGGADASSFDIADDSGQITVGAGTKLNYEGKKVYKVTVTATDPSQATATIDITINVTPVDEPPDISGDDVTREFAENGRNLRIHSFSASDPERRTVYWSLDIADSEYPDDEPFEISSNGVLSFKSSPDFEDTSLGGTNNVYKVIGDSLRRRPWRGRYGQDL